ncbi:MAG TPA: hypothetical protein VFP01_11050, partial [Propionibacteriaceae bacterium]|nr:hypothetical protein [Propionibacteriaceae bacterium]
GYEPVGEPHDEYEPAAEPEEAYASDELYDQLAQPEQVYESDEGYEKPAESDQAESDQVYDQLAEAEPVSHTDAEQTGAGDSQGDVAAFSKGDVEGGDANDNFASMDSLEGEIESAYDGELTAENDRMPDEQDERRRVDGEASLRWGSSVLH